MITNILLAMLLQNSFVIHYDIFTMTYPGITQTNISTSSGKGYVMETSHVNYEVNPIANIFWQNGAWNEGYVLAVIANYVGSEYFLSIDKSGTLSQIYLSSISIAELIAVRSWNPKNMQINVILYEGTF